MAIEHYFIVVSEHNIAEFRACLFLKPRHIHLIITQAMRIAARRFIATLTHRLDPETYIDEVVIAQQPALKGERADEIKQWIHHSLYPYLRHLNPSTEFVFNMTGGTKILSVLLAQAYGWSHIHYQPFLNNQPKLYIDQLRFDADNRLQCIGEIQPDAAFDLLDGLRLYADSVKSHQPNPIFAHPDSLTLAQLRFAAQQMPEATTDNLFPAITPILNTLWYKSTFPKDQTCEFLPWSSFKIPSEQIQTFFARLLTLLDVSRYVYMTNEGIHITIRNNNPKFNHWKKWLSGDWFEQLIQHWLQQLGIHHDRIQTGVQIAKAQSNGNETDILLLKNHQLHFLELKSDIADNITPQDFQNQLISQSDNLGKVNKALIISPLVQQKIRNITEERWLQFERNCQSKQIRVVVVHNAQSLSLFV